MSTLHYLQHADIRITKTEEAIKSLLSKTQSCSAAIHAARNNHYRVGVYKHFGQGRYSYELARDLRNFREECRVSKSKNLSFWAVFEQSDDLSESEFESCLWTELSLAASQSQTVESWNPHVSADAEDKTYGFELNGTAFSAVGLHPHSSDTSKRFSCPTLIFSIVENFHDLAAEGRYVPRLVATPKSEPKFHVSADSMSSSSMNLFLEEHGDAWSPFQFTGQQNTAARSCLRL